MILLKVEIKNLHNFQIKKTNLFRIISFKFKHFLK